MENTNFAETSNEDTMPKDDISVDTVTEADIGDKDTIPGDDTATETKEASTELDTEDALYADDELNKAANVCEPTVHIRYNHKDRQLSISEAATLSQKALAYESTMETMRELAASRSMSVKDFVASVAAAQKNADLNRLMNECGGNEKTAKRLLEVEHEKIKTAVKKMLEEEKTEFETDIAKARENIGAQFDELRNNCPEIKDVKDIPQAVFKMAGEKQMTLFDAYLRYQHTNRMNSETAARQQAAAKAASAGSMKSELTSSEDRLFAALKSGLW